MPPDRPRPNFSYNSPSRTNSPWGEKTPVHRAHTPTTPKQKSRKQVYLVAAASVAALIIGGGLLYAYYRQSQSSTPLPSSITSRVTSFKIYYPSGVIATNFTLEKSSVTYKSGVLEFIMKNTVGKTLVFSEEAEPIGFDPSSIQATKQVNTGYGQGFVTDISDRTTGSLISNDGTWVIVNAPNPVGASLMQQVVQGLSPASK